MKRPPLPSLIGDLVADRRAAGALLAGMAALFAAGMDPKVMAPMATTTQAAIRARPEIEGLIRRRVPDLPRPTRAERPYVYGTALWACGVVLISAGVLWLGGGIDNPLRIGLILAGIGLVVVFFLGERRRRAENAETVRIERRPVTIALFVGLVIAIAQIVPMSQLPLYFGVGMQYGPIRGMVALAPLFAALVVAGPIAGFLLARYQPRHLIAGGMLAIGLGDILLAAAIGPTTTYLAFIVPLLLVGAGFVVATTVRTAIIFASVPRGLPATAAALNEASIEVGTRAGIVVVTGLIAEVSVAVYTASLAGQPQAQVDGLVATFRDVLIALGTPSFQAVGGAIQQADIAVYKTAYFAGVQVAMLGAGAIGVIGSVVAWFTLGRRNPLQTVYEHRDERVPTDERVSDTG